MTNNKGRSSPPKIKQVLVKDIINLIENKNIIGVVDMENLPAKQLGNMRAQLRGKVDLIMTKRRIMSIALKDTKKEGVIELEKYLGGMPAFIFTDENPFALFKLLKKNMSTAPIKSGQTAPQDIIVPAGPTNFSPGPVIGELGSFKIKAGIENGKVVIKENSLVAKEGDVINEKLAALLTRLGIEPMLIGLNLKAVFEKGEILTRSVLDVDEEAYINNIKLAANEAFNLAMFIAYPTKDTTKLLLSKAHNEAIALAKSQDIMTSETIKETLAKADSQVNALKSKLNIQDVPKAEEKKEEVPAKEQSEENNNKRVQSSETASAPEPKVLSEPKEE